jgi:hypothetical protein
MRSPSEFICKPSGGKRYNSSKKIAGVDFILSSDADDHKFSNRYADVIEVPSGYDGPVKKGDILLVHHNVFKFYTGSKGRNMSGKSFLDADLFLIDSEQFFAYKRNGTWTAIDKYSFVEPTRYDAGIAVEFSGETPLHGKVFLTTPGMKEQGLEEGSIVVFTPESEYEFEIDGTRVYRIINLDLALIL